MEQTTSSETNQINLSFEDTQIAFASKNNFQLTKSYWIFAIMNLNWLVKLGTFFIKLFLFLHFPIKKLIKITIFQQFCGGESIEECNSTIKKLEESNIGTILDYSVEGEESQKSFLSTKNEILKTIEKAHKSASIPFAVFKITGIFNSELLEKFQAEQEFSPTELENFEESKTYLLEICQYSSELDVKLFIDAEESWIQNSIDELAYTMMKKFNSSKAIIYNTYQMYRVDMLDNLRLATENAQKENYFLGAKLVRGAYLEKERQRAHEEEYSEPIHKEKSATDKDFNLGLSHCLNNLPIIHFCIGTHNEESCVLLCDLMNQKSIEKNHPNIYFAQLLGMSDNISYNLASNGYNVAKYVPYGPIDAVMPYLFRRAEENSSIAGQTSREFALLQKEVTRRNNNEK
ncbi:proline dehydrogenase family protein [Aquirufa sp. ROCK2-A2]